MIDEKHREILKDARSGERHAIELCFALLSTANAIDRDCAARLRPHGLSEGKFAILSLLRRAPGGLSPHELAARAGVARATVTGLLDRLERAALLRREADPEDRRMIRIRLTPEGAALAADLVATHARWIATLTGGLTGGEQARLGALLRKVWARTDAGRAQTEGVET